jgi:hypothetical protein
MVRCKTTALKLVMNVRSPKHAKIGWVLERPLKSHNKGNTAGYFPRKLRSLLNALDYHDESLYIGKKTPLCNGCYKWEVHVSVVCTTPLLREPNSRWASTMLLAMCRWFFITKIQLLFDALSTITS